jgi:hypothetical protein
VGAEIGRSCTEAGAYGRDYRDADRRRARSRVRYGKFPAAEDLDGKFRAVYAALLSSMAARGFKIERSSANHR